MKPQHSGPPIRNDTPMKHMHMIWISDFGVLAAGRGSDGVTYAVDGKFGVERDHFGGGSSDGGSVDDIFFVSVDAWPVLLWLRWDFPFVGDSVN